VINLVKVIKPAIPRRVGNYLRKLHRNYLFNKTLRKYIKKPEDILNNDLNYISSLIYGWRNEDWSALEEYLFYVLKQSFKTNGAILECGSGLSTILLGVVAQKTGNTVLTLEHNPKWVYKVSNVLRDFNIDSVHLLT